MSQVQKLMQKLDLRVSEKNSEVNDIDKSSRSAA